MGGMTHDRGEWPTFEVPALRLWDSRTTWRDLEPEPDRWEFGTLDAILGTAAAHGTSDVLLVLAGTPEWAARRTRQTDAPWIGPGSASPPTDLRDWFDFVHTVAERYRGRIGAYEIGNEPNLLTFWNGTSAQWAAYVAVAAYAVHSADPSARIVADVGLLRGTRDLATLGAWAAPVVINPYVDVLAVHAYPDAAGRSRMPRLLQDAHDLLAAMGRGRPSWVTEVNVSDGSSLRPRRQATAVRSLTRAIEAAGFQRAYWYAWTALGPDELIQLSPQTPGARALAQLVGPTP